MDPIRTVYKISFISSPLLVRYSRDIWGYIKLLRVRLVPLGIIKLQCITVYKVFTFLITDLAIHSRTYLKARTARFVDFLSYCILPQVTYHLNLLFTSYI